MYNAISEHTSPFPGRGIAAGRTCLLLNVVGTSATPAAVGVSFVVPLTKTGCPLGLKQAKCLVYKKSIQ